jgi:glucose/mannose-6-phosphate isomerase
MLAILKPILPIKESDVLESIESLKFIGIKINSENISTSNPALKIAEWIEHTPVIYFPGGLQSAAIRFKNSLQENCKIHVIAEDVIEACHNGIVSWEKSRNFQPILIRGTDDFEKTVQLWNTIKQFFDSKQINYKEIVSEKGNILTKLISMIYLLDYASIYLSVKLGIDPTPVEAIDFIKKACK